ncbi:MAG: HNH endonuclease [bacterium]
MKCIYCLEEKGRDEYLKDEHVMPQSFGVFKSNFVLKAVVCDQCNQYFGDNLEIDLARDTFEGIARYEHGVKKAKEFKSLGKKSKLLIKVGEGFFKGAYVYRDYSPDIGKIIVKPVPQVGFLKKEVSEYDFFRLDEIPLKANIVDDKYDLDNVQGIIILGCRNLMAVEELQKKGYVFKIKGESDCPSTSADDWLCEVNGKIDQKIFRAMAKIAFNYLAFWEGPEFVQYHGFDIIRRFVRYGDKVEYPLYHIDNQSILEDERESSQRRLGHIITVNWADDRVSIISKVSLFNWAIYYISLARNFSGERRAITRGHLFNIYSKDILELGVNKKA